MIHAKIDVQCCMRHVTENDRLFTNDLRKNSYTVLHQCQTIHTHIFIDAESNSWPSYNYTCGKGSIKVFWARIGQIFCVWEVAWMWESTGTSIEISNPNMAAAISSSCFKLCHSVLPASKPLLMGQKNAFIIVLHGVWEPNQMFSPWPGACFNVSMSNKNIV